MHLQRPHPCIARASPQPPAPPFIPLRNTASAAPQNQLHLQNAVAKFARWAAMCYAGFALKPAPRPQLHFRCSAKKKTTVKKSYQETPFKKVVSDGLPQII